MIKLLLKLSIVLSMVSCTTVVEPEKPATTSVHRETRTTVEPIGSATQTTTTIAR